MLTFFRAVVDFEPRLGRLGAEGGGVGRPGRGLALNPLPAFPWSPCLGTPPCSSVSPQHNHLHLISREIRLPVAFEFSSHGSRCQSARWPGLGQRTAAAGTQPLEPSLLTPRGTHTCGPVWGGSVHLDHWAQHPLPKVAIVTTLHRVDEGPAHYPKKTT